MVVDSTVMSLGEIFSLILLLLVIANNLQLAIYAYAVAWANLRHAPKCKRQPENVCFNFYSTVFQPAP